MKTRYENFRHYERLYKKDIQLPCVFFSDQFRTPTKKSPKANWHENPEIQYVVQGEGYVIIDGEKHAVTAGDIIVINSNCVHYTGTDTEIKYTAMIVNIDFCHYADIDFDSVTFETVVKSERAERLFSDILAAYGETGRICKKARLQSVLLRLLIELREYHTLLEERTPQTSPSFDHVKLTIRFIRDNFMKKLTLDEISKNVHADKYSLSRSFKALTGQTIVQYINNYRCERAKELIQLGTSVNQAAVQCGFNNISFFTKTFKSYTGKLPSEYKQK